MQYTNLVKNDLDAVEQKIRSQAIEFHGDLQNALDIILESGGKRIRPTVTILCGKMFNADTNRLVTLASAIELLHTATLVHDDLIDGAFLRRGVPTLNTHWSPGATVLTGDFLFAAAANLAAETESIEVQKIFATTLKIIVNGEITQMFGERCNVDRQIYKDRIFAKTASLFQTAAKSAGLISQTQPKEIHNLGIYGYEIGMAFQIIDDILDFTGEQATVGKPVGSDLRHGLVTLPSLIFIESHSNDELVKMLLAGNCLEDLEKIDQLIQNIQNSDAINKAFQVANDHVHKALDSIKDMRNCPEKSALMAIAEYIIDRDL